MLVRDLYTVFRNNKCSEEMDMRSYRSCNDQCETLGRDPMPNKRSVSLDWPKVLAAVFEKLRVSQN